MNSRDRTNSGNLVVGLDCSTTGTKAIAFNERGKIAAEAHASNPLVSPQPGYYEQNPEDWWTAARKSLKAIASEVGSERIIALAISNQRETFVPLNEDGHPIRPAIVWLDERCRAEVESFAKKIGKSKIHRITGKPVDYAPVVYRLAWMKINEPRLYQKIHKVCDVHTYLVWKLTGQFRTSWASADPLGLLDMRQRRWAPQIMRALELETGQLPEVFSPGSALGTITKQAADLTGLAGDTLIIAGGGDGQAAGLGVNALVSGRAYLNLGTAIVAGIYSSMYKTSKAFRTMSCCSKSGYYFECSLRAGTFAVDWFIKEFLGIDPLKQKDIYEKLELEARQIAPGCNGLLHLPYLCGAMNPYWDMNARGAFIGLSSSHHRGHMYRSILEGIAFEQLFALHGVERVIGRKVHSLMAIGGGAASNLWCQILADITGKTICLPQNREASALGAAIAAAVGAGWYPSFREAANAMAGVRKEIKPISANYRKYQSLFPVYRKLYPCLKSSVGHRGSDIGLV